MTNRKLALVAGFVLTALVATGHARDTGLERITRDELIDLTQELASRVEILDTELHNANLEGALVDLVHHSEETVFEFVDLLTNDAPQATLEYEFRHIRQDVTEIRRAINDGQYSYRIWKANWYVWTAYRVFAEGYYAYEPGVTPPPPPPPPPGGDLALNGKKYAKLGEGNLTTAPDSIAGTGAVIFAEPLAEEDNNLTVTADLQPGASVAVVANADATLKGLDIVFQRGANDLLEVRMVTNGQSLDLTPDFEGLKVTGPLTAEIDVHGHGHLIIWVNGGEEREFAFNGQLTGSFYGLRLSNAKVTQLKVGPPKEEH